MFVLTAAPVLHYYVSNTFREFLVRCYKGKPLKTADLHWGWTVDQVPSILPIFTNIPDVSLMSLRSVITMALVMIVGGDRSNGR